MEHQQIRQPDIIAHGLNSVIVRFGLRSSPELTKDVRAAYDLLSQSDVPGMVQVAASLTTIMLEFDRSKTDRETFVSAIRRRLLAGQTQALAPSAKRLWTIPVCFASRYAPQLKETAAAAKTDEKTAIKAICETPLEVLTIGFAPGQPYIGLLPEVYDIPRQSQLTPLVPAGALILAIRQLILFTSDNATGWRHVGQSAFMPFQIDRAEPFALRAGDRIRFQTVGADQMDQLLSQNASGLGGAICTEAT